MFPSNVVAKKGKQEPSLDLAGIGVQDLSQYDLECVWSIETAYWQEPLRTATLRWNLGQLKTHHRNRVLLKDGQGRTQRDPHFLSGLLSSE